MNEAEVASAGRSGNLDPLTGKRFNGVNVAISLHDQVIRDGRFFIFR